jgi:predicted permease
MARWFRRVMYALRQSRHEAELREEMETHRAMRAAELERGGLSPGEAAAASRRALGNAVLARDDVRDAWLGSGSWWQDVRFGARTLRRSPAFTGAAVLTLALGIGVNTGLFTVLNGLMFRGLRVPDAGQLAAISQQITGVRGLETRGFGTFSTAEYETYRDGARTLESLAAYAPSPETTLSGATPQVILGATVSCNFFDTLRQPPVIGRGLVAQDCAAGAAPVVVLGHDLWTRAFSADPGVLGRTVVLNRQPFSVVGVASPGTYAGPTFGVVVMGYLAPLTTEPLLRPDLPLQGGHVRWLSLLGRRRADATLEEVRAELPVIAARLDRQQPGRRTVLSIDQPTNVPAEARVGAAAATIILMTAFGCVLLIACANVANLLLARGTARAQEIAIRMSLGASRGRVVRQLAIESGLLALLGGTIGSVVAAWSFQGLITAAVPAVLPPGLPVSLAVDVRPDLQVVAFAALLTVVTGMLFGLAPALHASRPDLNAIMKQNSAGGAPARAGRLRGMLVGVQVALCMALVVAAGLLLRGLQSTYAVEPGFAYRDVAYASLESAFSVVPAEQIADLCDRVTTAVAAVPGVVAVAFTDQEPLGDDASRMLFRLPDEGPPQVRVAEVQSVTPNYFSILELPILRGRTFSESEMASAGTGPGTAIVSSATARLLWPGADPIGRTLLMRDRTLEIVGVVADAQVSSIGYIDPLYIYLPGWGPVVLAKTAGQLGTMVAGIQQAVRTMDPTLVIPVFPLEATLDWWRGISATVTTVGAALGVLALVLAAVGIYGVVSYAVTKRYREIGIRMALGADAAAVLRLVLGQTMKPVAIGAAVGVVAALGLSQVLSAVLFGVGPADPIGLGGAALLVVLVACASGLLAARPATQADPTSTLRA